MLTAAALIATAVGAGLLWRRRRATPDQPTALRTTGVGARRARLAAVGARAGADWATHRARRVFASAERKVELDTAFELRTAEQVAAALGEMKGALMKLGQMASYLDQGLPEHVRGALAQLQSDAPPMSAELAADLP